MVNLRAGRMMWALLSAVFALTFLGDRPNLRGWGGISMIVSGVLLLVFRRLRNVVAVSLGYFWDNAPFTIRTPTYPCGMYLRKQYELALSRSGNYL
ncbi:hypothetical protein ACO0K2_18085 [Undibacterium sp. MH2W]|uniref:hypothetical protein n=1 Tax=Undibacterium sp. MH2W TaxID=3413044 RepID=UPI003BF0ACFD